MSAQTKDVLKQYFETGDKPTQIQFANLIDSFRSTLDPITSDDLADTLLEFITNNANSNIYNTNGVLQGNRTLQGDNNSLTFDTLAEFVVRAFDGFKLKNNDNFSAIFRVDTLNENRIIQIPNNSGTVALLTDIPTDKADLVGGLVPSSQLPSYVDDVLEYPNFASFPNIGSTSRIYIAIDTNKAYRWGGSTWVILNDTVALGETVATAYRGDRGKTAYDHSQITGANPHGATTSHISEGSNLYFTAARALAAALTGYVSGAGTISTGDTILQAIQKLNGNLAAKIKDFGEQVYSSSMSITTSSSAPSGITGHYYQWSQNGRLVNMSLYLRWATAGSGMTQLLLDLPADMPVPANITTGSTSTLALFYTGSGNSFNTPSGTGQTIWVHIVRGDGTTRASRIMVNHTSQANSHYQLMLQYFTEN